jgi:hypothetical protein
VPDVPLLVSGPQSLTLRTVHGADNDIVTWWGTRTECISALNKLRRQGELSSQEVADARVLLDHLSNSWAEMPRTERVHI